MVTLTLICVSVFYLVQAGDNGVVTFDIGIEDEHGNSTIISDDDGDA